jgi:hypothetical protein
MAGAVENADGDDDPTTPRPARRAERVKKAAAARLTLGSPR